jgi:hypothetical protein
MKWSQGKKFLQTKQISKNWVEIGRKKLIVSLCLYMYELQVGMKDTKRTFWESGL